MTDENPPRAKVPTIKDVARIANVSVGTASKVINDDATVRDRLRRRVQDAIRQLGYQPNALAQGMRRSGTGIVGCTISDISHPVIASMVSSAEMVLSDAGFGMVLTSHRDQLRHEKRLFEFLLQRRVDGLIGTVIYDDEQTVPESLKNAQMPIVLMEREFGDWFDTVVSDQDRGCYLLTKHLLDLGHTRIGILTPPHQSRPGRDRIKAFNRAHAEVGLIADPTLVLDRENRVDTGFRDTYLMLTGANRPTAIIISVNELPGVMQAVKMCDLSVPRDISIASCGDSDLAAMINPAVTCFRWDPARIGQYAAELLIARLHTDRDRPKQRIVLGAEVILRDSCAPPPRLAP